MTTLTRQAFILILCASLAACATSSARGALDNLLNDQIGRPMDDPDGFRAHYLKDRVSTNRGPRGHIEEEYRLGLHQNCRIFLEIDNAARKIVTWRYGLPDDDCLFAPGTSR